jgi:predicted permease
MSRIPLWRRYARLFGPDPKGDVEEELQFHLQAKMDDLIQQGWQPDAARREAERQFGDVWTVRREGERLGKERQQKIERKDHWDELVQDLRYALRTLRRDRGFTVIAVLILALGIAANTAVFSVVNAVLLRPLPFHDPQQLTWLEANEGKGGLSDVTYTVAAFEEFQRHNRSFQQVTSYQTFYNSIQYKLTGYGEPLPVFGVQVAGNFFQTLGVEPILGRLFSHEECQKGGRPVALLSYPFWQRQFAGNPDILGQAITINQQPVTVIGVMPDTFDFGSVFSPGLKVDFFVPAIMDVWRTWGNTLALVGRLKPGVTISQAQAESNILFPQLRAAHPDWWEDYKSTIVGLKDHVSGRLRHSLIVLWCAVSLILLIVCMNLSNLMLARAAARSKEFAMRRALGAGRGRLFRQLLTESLVLSSMGASLGLGLAFAIVFYVGHQGSIALPLLTRVNVDGAALSWTLLVTVAATVLFGFAPGLRISAGSLQDTLKDSGHGMSTSRKHERVRTALVISEVTLACVLLVGAGLLLRSFLHVLDTDLGFQPAQAAAIKIDYDDQGNPAKRGAILQEILHRVSGLPGIESAGITDMLPLDRNRSWGFQAKGRQYHKGELLGAMVYVITPGYLRTMGMQLREGRDFSWRDTDKSQRVVIINQAAARYHWPDQDPVGRIALVAGQDARVVGIISNVRESSVEEASSPEMYLPITQAGPEGAELVVRSRLPLEVLQSSVMRTLRSLNPGQPATTFRPIQEIVDHAISPRRFFVVLVSSFAALGMLLASLGIYGVMSYSVTRRRQEIGIRMALGATGSRVQLGVLANALRMAFIGVVLGTIGSLIAAKWIASLLYGTKPRDPATFGAIVLLLTLVALVASYVPARRASRLDPMIALRDN